MGTRNATMQKRQFVNVRITDADLIGIAWRDLRTGRDN